MKIENSKTYSKFIIFNLLLLAACCLLPTEASAWTQTDWSGGDSTFFWSATDATRYDTGVSVSGNNPTGAVSMSDTGLVGFWDFNDRGDVGYLGESAEADSAYDRTLNGNNGTISGCMWGDTSNQDSAVYKGGLTFDGENDYVNCGNKSSLDVTAITIEAWVKVDSFLAFTAIISKTNNWSGRYIGYGLYLSTGKLYFKMGNGTEHYAVTCGSAISLGVWQHVVATYDSTTLNFYYNGNNVGSYSHSYGNIASSSYDLLIGKQPDGSDFYFNGAIDEVKIYSRALSAEEIAAHANAYSTKDLGLVGYWKFDDGGDVGFDGISADDSTLSDETSNNNDGAITGCMWGDTSNDDSALFGGGLSFDGINNYVNCGTKANLDFSNSSFTITGWIYPLGLASRHGIVSRRGGAGGYWQLCTYNGDRIEFYVHDLSSAKSASIIVPLSTWTFFTAMIDRDSDLLKLSINGGSFTTTDISGLGIIGSNADPVRIGYEKANNKYFNGAMDEVKIYRRVLSADEIADLADSTIVITKSQSLGENSPRGVLLSSTFDAASPVVWKTIEWNNPSSSTDPYNRGDSRLRKDEGSLKALWHFDEGEDVTAGTSADDSVVYDESTNSNTGIVYECKWGDASEDSAVFQSGLSLNGTSNYVGINHSVVPLATNNGSISLWIKPNFTTASGSNEKGLFYSSSSQNDGSGPLQIFFKDNKLNFYRSGGGGGAFWFTTTANLPEMQNTWHHLAFTWYYSAGNLQVTLYVDGVSQGEQSWTDGIDKSNYLQVGRYDRSGTWYYFDGAIDEVAIYSYAKNAQEIWQDARGTQIRLRTQTTSSILDGTGSDSPIALWHFDNLLDNPSSTVAYDSCLYTTKHNGTLHGGVSWYQWGVFGKCLSFDGTNDYVNCGDVGLGTTRNLTIEFWVNQKSPASWKNPLSFGEGKFRFETGNPVSSWNIYESGINSSTITFPAGCISSNEWIHVAFTSNTSNWFVYIDGIERVSGTTDGDFNGGNLTIGARAPGSNPWNGLIDEVAIYPRAKTAKEIAIDARGWSRWSPYYKSADEDDIVLFADDFNDGVVGIGGFWQEYGKGTWLIDNTTADTGALKITGLSSGDTGIIQANNTNWYNYQVETKVKIASGGRAGVILNWNRTGSDNGYAAILDVAANQLKLFAVDTNGITGSILDNYIFTSLSTNTWYTLKAQYDGSKIRVYIGDTNRITYDVSDYTYKGYAGLIADNAIAYFDNFKVFPIDRYVHYEATLTDNVVRDTTPYLYWVKLTYEDTTSEDTIWSKIIQDRHTYSTLTPRNNTRNDELDFSDIDGADTVWCYNLDDYTYDGNATGPDDSIKVNVATPALGMSRVDLRLGIRTTSALSNYTNEWPEDIDDYTWSDWRQYASGEGYEGTAEGDTITWTLTYSTTNLGTDFATEGGYILQSRAVSSTGGTEPAPTNFKPNDDNDRRDTAIIYMMRDITPPGSEYSEGGVDGVTSLSGYTAETCANSAASGANTLWTLVGVKGIRSDTKDTDSSSYRLNTEYVWFNIESSADDSGIRVKVLDQNPVSGRTNDCSDIDETDSSIRYRYSVDGGANWKGLDSGDATSDVATWAYADTNIWTDRYIVIKDAPAEAKNTDDGASGLTDAYRYSIASLDPGADDHATKGENVLIQFAQKDKAGNWGYSHRAATYYATQTSGCSTTNKGYYINIDLLRPVSKITKGPREANYSTSASFEFKDNSENDSPLLCAFSTQLELNASTTKTHESYTAVTGYTWTDYQPWSPTSDEGSATFTDLDSSDYWYRCFVKAKDEALNLSADADSAVYYFQCLAPVPNTIIYSGPAGIVTDDNGSYGVVFKYKGEGGNTPTYEFNYSTDGGDSWSGWSAASVTAQCPSYTVGYGNHTFMVKARNSGGTTTADEDQTPASVTFTIEDPNKPSTIAPPSDPVKYWREESE